MPKITVEHNGTTYDVGSSDLPVKVYYGGTTEIATLTDGQTKVFPVGNKIAANNIVLGTKKLLCAGKAFATNLNVRVAAVPSVINIPTIGNIQYTGGAITPSYDSAKLTATGNTSATELGTYQIKFTIKDKDTYKWNDNTQEDKIVTWSIIKKKVTVPSLSGTYTYNKANQTVTVNGLDTTWVTQTGTATAKNYGTYTVKWNLKDTTHSEWSDSTVTEKSANWTINKKSVTIPTLSGPYQYNKSEQTVTINNFDSAWASKSGTEKATVVGNYNVVFSLLDTTNTTWSDGTIANVTKSWSITVRSITVPTVSGSYTYDKAEHSASISGYDSAWMTQTGTTKSTNAGSWTITFALTDKTNTQWAGGTTTDKTGSWSIAVRKLTIPSVSGTYTYNGSAQTVTTSDFNSTYETKSGDTATNVGTHTVTFALSDKVNTAWSDNTTTDKTKDWSIGKLSLTVPGVSGSYTYSGSEQTVTKTNFNSTYEEVTGDKATNAGTHTAVFTLKDTNNTQWSGGSIEPQSKTWSIGKAAGYITLQTTGTQSISNGATGTNTIQTNHGGTLSASNGGSDYCSVSVSGTTVSVVHKGNTGSSARTVTITVTCAATDNYNQASATYKVSLAKSSCVTGDTLVLMGDGVTEKQIRDILVGESVMTWNMVSGKYEPQEVSVVYDENNSICLRTLHLHFSNGKIVKVAGEHGFFDYTANTYSYIEEENYETFIGHEFVTYENGKYGLTTLVKCEIVDNVKEEIWSLQTAYNENFVTEGILGITQEYKPGRYEYFEFGEGIKWDKEKMQKDIETYGLFIYDEWKEVISEEDFYKFNGPWFKILIGKGIIDLEDIGPMIAVTPSLAE